MNVNNLNQDQPRTREEYKRAKIEAQQKNAKKKVEATPNQTIRVRTRMIPIWLRLVLLVVFMVLSLFAGASVGYGLLGGGEVAEVFKESTWTHILDLVNKK